MICGIYRIIEVATGRCYVGQSVNISKRWKAHNKKWPTSDYIYEVLLECPEEHLNELEIFLIEELESHKNGLNKTIGGTSIKVRYPDKETLAKISASKMGNKHGVGRKMSDHNKAKLLDAVKGVPKSEEHKAKLSAASKGKPRPPRSEEWCKKISNALRARREI